VPKTKKSKFLKLQKVHPKWHTRLPPGLRGGNLSTKRLILGGNSSAPVN